MFQSKPGNSAENREIESEVLRELGLDNGGEFVNFANSLRLFCPSCKQARPVRYQEELVGLMRMPGSGTCFVVTCTHCLAQLLVCCRFPSILHIEHMTGPSDMVSALQRAEHAIRAGRAQQGDLRTASQPRPGPAQEATLYWYQKGTAEFSVGRLSQAIAYFDRALSINPHAAKVWRDKGAAMARTGALAEASDCHTRSLDLNASDATTWFNKGTTLRRLGRTGEALQCFDRAIGIDPSDPDVWVNRGLSLQALGRAAEAISSYDGALARDEGHLEAWLNKGCALGEQGNARGALECFDRVLKLNPMDTDAWFSKAVALLNLRDFGQARTALQRFVQIADPADGRRAQALGIIGQLRT